MVTIMRLHPRVLKQVLDEQTPVKVFLQALRDEVFCFFADLTEVVIKLKWVVLNRVVNRLFVVSPEWRYSTQQNVCNAPKAPDVNSVVVNLLSNQLRRHVKWASQTEVKFFAGSVSCCKPKVCELHVNLI